LGCLRLRLTTTTEGGVYRYWIDVGILVKEFTKSRDLGDRVYEDEANGQSAEERVRVLPCPSG